MLIDAIATHALRTPDKLACIELGSERRWSYREFDQTINQVANWLVAELGPASAKRVATVARNSASMLILNLACVRAGAIFVPCNWRLSRAETAIILADVGPAMVFCGEEFPPDDRGENTFLLSDLLSFGGDKPATPPVAARQSAGDTALLLYTSGTSGRPKGVMLSETNIFWSQVAFNSGNQVCSKSVFLCDMPLFHTAGLLVNARAPLLVGGTVLISSGFDVEKTLLALSNPKFGVTHYFSVPQMAARLWDHPMFDPEKLHHLQVYATGGAPNPKPQIERFIQAGIPMSDGFGMTETGSVSGMPVDDREVVLKKAGSSGALYFSLEARIVNEHGESLASGDVGELWLRGPGITSGYWNQPDKTQEVFCGDWFKTGDMARIDEDGFLFIVDRKKDMFISGGENVYSIELETAIAELTEVMEVAVIGFPDEVWGEIGIAFVVPASGKTIGTEAIHNHCRKRLAAYKVPKKIVVRDSLPRTSTGKIQKQRLKEELLAGQ